MSQSSTNASSTNANTGSTPQSQVPLSGFANFANQPNPGLPIQIPQYSQQQQQQLLQNIYPHQMQQQTTASTFNPDPFSLFLAQQMFQQTQQQLHSIPFPPPQQQPEIVEETQEEPVDTSLPGTSQARKKKSTKKVQWTEAEEELLAKSWIHISEDCDIANNQADRQFWTRTMTLYNDQAVSFGFSPRNKDQLNSKFTALSAQVKIFAGHYAEAERLRTSGADDASVLEAARVMFRNTELSKFRYEKAWIVLRDKSRWRTYAKIETPNTAVNLDDVEIPDDIFADDTVPRPRGKSRGSKRKESSSASETAQSQATSLCAGIVEQFKKLTRTKQTIAKAKKKLMKQQEDVAYTQAREKDLAFLVTPTTGMTEREALWVENEKNRIREKYGMI